MKAKRAKREARALADLAKREQLLDQVLPPVLGRELILNNRDDAPEDVREFVLAFNMQLASAYAKAGAKHIESSREGGQDSYRGERAEKKKRSEQAVISTYKALRAEVPQPKVDAAVERTAEREHCSKATVYNYLREANAANK